MKVKDYMCKNVCWATPSNTVQECATMMNNNHVGCIPVCDNSQKVVGLVTDRDITLRCIANNKDPKTTPVSEIMTCEVCCCNANTDIDEAEDLMYENQVKRIPVIDNNKIVGILTLGDLSKKINDEEVNETLNGICNSDRNNAE